MLKIIKKYYESHKKTWLLWGNKKDRKKYKLDNKKNGIILSNSESLQFKDDNYDDNSLEKLRNFNRLIISSPGTRLLDSIFYPLILNIKKTPTNFIINDEKGELYQTTVYYFKEILKYKVKVVNLDNPQNGNNYNPLIYCNNYDDIENIVNSIISNININLKKDIVCEVVQGFYLKSILLYVYSESQEKTLPKAYEYMGKTEKELQEIFTKLELKSPNNKAIKNWKDFMKTSKKTREIVVTLIIEKLQLLINEDIRKMMSKDNLDLDTVDEKTVIFLINSGFDKRLNFLSALFFKQCFNILESKAINVYKDKLPIHYQLLFEVENIGKIVDLPNIIIKSNNRNISFALIIQNENQLIKRYGEDGLNLIKISCSSYIYLGSPLYKVHESISNLLDKIRDIRVLKSKIKKENSSLFMSPEEIKLLSKEKCIIIISEEVAFLSDKYKIKKDPDYKYLRNYKNIN